MALPTATEETTSREAVKRDFNDIDSLISELNIQKEEINAGPTANQRGVVNQPPSAGSEFAGPGFYSDQEPEPTEQIPPEIAALSGKAIAGTIDTVLSTGFSLYAHSSEPEKYEASQKQIEKLNVAWQAVAQKYNYKIEDSPWFNVILLTVAVYLPIMQEAKKDRRFAEMDERLKELQRQIQDNEARLNVVEKQNELKK